MKSKISRRVFLSGTFTALTASSALRILGSNDRIRLGVIGSGNRARYLMRTANEIGNIEWAAVSDIWDVSRDKAAETAGKQVSRYPDYRSLLDRKDINGVIVGTFDHVHSQITVDACRSGKDVYVEKPLTSLPMQGHEIVRAVRETKRIVQVGVQQRSIPHFIEARQRFFDSGLMGQVAMVRTIWNSNRGYLTPVPPEMERKPAGLDWDKCLAWLPKIPWDAKRYFNRFAYWDFSTGGQTGGLFVHMVDVIHWFLNIKKSSSAVALGGIYQYDDGRDTPDNINLILKYPEKINVTFEASITDLVRKEAADIVFMGSGGRLYIFRYGYKFLPAEENEHLGEITFEKGTGSATAHVKNWLDCMRTRKQPNANVIDGHYSSMACHIGNIAYKEKSRVVWRNEWDV